MAFPRLQIAETSAEAELDAVSILEWLLAQYAGDAGLRWFMAMDEAIASLADRARDYPLSF
jgi:hypothetical protein